MTQISKFTCNANLVRNLLMSYWPVGASDNKAGQIFAQVRCTMEYFWLQQNFFLRDGEETCVSKGKRTVDIVVFRKCYSPYHLIFLGALVPRAWKAASFGVNTQS